MATSNFWVRNAQSYYVFGDTYETENDEGQMVEVERDDWEWNELLNDIRYYGEDSGLFPNSSDTWNHDMDARELCCSDTQYETFGKGNAWLTDTHIESKIFARSGYYAGMVLDYDITLESTEGDVIALSYYNGDVDRMVSDYMDTLEYIISNKGSMNKWNIGTFKMQNKNIRKWLTKCIEREVEKCEKFCKEVSDTELCVMARFSNGETIYAKVGE